MRIPTTPFNFEMMCVDRDTVDKLLRLSQLSVDDQARLRVIEDLEKIVALIDQLQSVETEGVEPLAHPLEVSQPLRDDVATEDVDRERFQSIAPQVADGLYLVPRVVE